jgi:hypothetical protein
MCFTVSPHNQMAREYRKWSGDALRGSGSPFAFRFSLFAREALGESAGLKPDVKPKGGARFQRWWKKCALNAL